MQINVPIDSYASEAEEFICRIRQARRQYGVKVTAEALGATQMAVYRWARERNGCMPRAESLKRYMPSLRDLGSKPLKEVKPYESD